MSAEDVRKLYLEEVKILASLIDAARSSANARSEIGKRLTKSWGDFLRMRQKGLEKSLYLGDEEIRTDIEAEVKQLNTYISAHNSDGHFVTDWDVFLKCERDLSKDVLDLCNR